MTPERFATHSLPAPDQFEAWRVWFHSVFDVMPRQLVEEGFPAESQLWKLDGLAVSRVSAPAIHVARTKALIRRDPVDHWVITLGHRVTTAVRTAGASLEAPAGVPFVLSLGNELISERSRDERLQFYLPRNSFCELAPMLDAVRGTVLNTPLGRLLADYMLLLERNLPDLTPEDLPRLTGAVRAMVGACIVPSPDRLAAATSQIGLGRLERVRRAVRRHLRSPSLGPDMLCREVGTSRSQLYRLLEGESGVARYIQRQRLLEGHVALCDVSNIKRIAVIAEELCFADASGFSRAFRQEFAMSPSDVRAASLAGLAPAAMPKDRIGPEVRNLSDCLRAF
jgi:AraC-like DNA-binding protein